MIIKTINNPDSFFLTSEKEASIFTSKKWLSVYGKELNLIGIYKDDGIQIIGGFYYYLTKKGGFNFIKLPPYTPHCGLFFHCESKNNAAKNNFTKEVMTEVCNYFDKQNKALTILAFPSNVIDLQPFIWSKYKVIPNYTYRIHLKQSIEEIIAGFDPKNRNAISKANKEGITVTENKLGKDALYNFFVNSLNETNANVYEKELRNIFLNFSEKTNSFSLEAWLDTNLVGVVFCIYDANSCYYLLGGVNKSAGVAGINNLLILKSIEKAKGIGCSIFDFEGSMLKGVEKFFRSFGPDLVPYYTVNKASLPLEVFLKFKKRENF